MSFCDKIVSVAGESMNNLLYVFAVGLVVTLFYYCAKIIIYISVLKWNVFRLIKKREWIYLILVIGFVNSAASGGFL